VNEFRLEPGLYANIFRVNVPDQETVVFITQASKCPILRDLRLQIEQQGWKVRLYRDGDLVFAYGQDVYRLASLSLPGFQQQVLRLYSYPKWCARLIREGLSDHLKSNGYRERFGKGRPIFYEPKPYRTVVGGKLKVFRGYDLRTIYLYQQDRPIFGLIVDICWEIQDSNGRRLNMVEIDKVYNASAEVAQVQDELLPNNKINPEVARLRLQNHILPFVFQNKEFHLPLDKVKASLELEPLRIILGEEMV